jgi:hypothetical protein
MAQKPRSNGTVCPLKQEQRRSCRWPAKSTIALGNDLGFREIKSGTNQPATFSGLPALSPVFVRCQELTLRPSGWGL